MLITVTFCNPKWPCFITFIWFISRFICQNPRFLLGPRLLLFCLNLIHMFIAINEMTKLFAWWILTSMGDSNATFKWGRYIYLPRMLSMMTFRLENLPQNNFIINWLPIVWFIHPIIKVWNPSISVVFLIWSELQYDRELSIGWIDKYFFWVAVFLIIS